MNSMDDRREPAAGSVVIAFQVREAEDPVCIVIGPSHRPYFVFHDGHEEVVSSDPPPPVS